MTPAISATRLDPWKPCDLRGLFPDPISPSLFANVGRAVGTILPASSRVLIAGDFRLSTIALKTALAKGLISAGMTVLDAGQLPTPVAYFSGRRLQADAVLIVTASHNPAADNGLKLMIGKLPPTPELLADLRSLIEAAEFRVSAGHVESVSCVADYKAFMHNRWGQLASRRRPSLILDSGNGAWSDLAPELMRQLGFDFECLACVVDGSFPSRSPDCSRTRNLAKLSDAVIANPGSIGIAWDGDGDRVAFVDESGAHVSSDEIAILIARQVLSKCHLQEAVVADIKFSDLVRREVIAAGGRPVLERSGHSFMRGRILSENAVLGLDACGHYFFREIDNSDDGLFSALVVLDILAHHQCGLAELLRALPEIFATPELRIPAGVISFRTVTRRLAELYPGASVLRVDGIRLAPEIGVVLARESSTEPVVSLRVEGYDAAACRQLLTQVLNALPEAKTLLLEQLPNHARKDS